MTLLMFIFILRIFCVKPSEFSDDIKLRSSTDASVQARSVVEMIERRLPQYHFLFTVSVDQELARDGRDAFRISSPMSYNDSRVLIKGSSGVAAAWGFLYYLKYYCKAHISWEADQLSIPSPLPSAQVKITANDWYRYYENVCTVSYSFVWWDWRRWERHIDWMAMNGINFPLAFTAQEAIWRRVYLGLNVTQDELDEHFVGPAFLAWGRMGNIKGWGGPLSDSWHQKTFDLQNKILRRMRDFGMIPVLPGFAGHIPKGIIRQFPNVNYTRLSAWGHFEKKGRKYTRTYMLNPTEPLFGEIGRRFIEEMKKAYNLTDHFYNCDPFNEETPASGDPKYIKALGEAIFNSMKSSDPSAVWVMQGWMFRSAFWTHERAKALLTSVPQGRMIVLDLMTNLQPLYKSFDYYFGQPFIFGFLANFGGVDGLYGNLDLLLKNMAEARADENATMIGSGITSEGINQNYAMYDLFLELSFRRAPLNASLWAMEYSRRRYGITGPEGDLLAQAWRILMRSVYNFNFKDRYHGEDFLLTHRPSLDTKFLMKYNVSDLIRAWDMIILASKKISMDTNEKSLNSPQYLFASENDEDPEGTLEHDLVDITREILQVYGNDLVVNMRKAYHLGSLTRVRRIGTAILELLDDLDDLLGTCRSFLLGDWLRRAESWATNQKERRQYLENSLHQISLWGPNGEILDYAVKQWSGVVSQYMKPRWRLFIQELLQSLVTGKKFDEDQFQRDVFVGAEKVFATGINVPYSQEPQGDAIKMASRIYKKYRIRLNRKFERRMSKTFHRSMKAAAKRENNEIRTEWSFDF